MDELRSIIREEVRRTLFGHPIPEKGEVGYKPYWHDLDTVSIRASHYHATSDAYEGAILEIRSFLEMESILCEEKLQQVSQVVRKCEKEIRQLNSEWRQDNKNLKNPQGK